MGSANNPDGGFSNAIQNSVMQSLPFDDKSRYWRFEEDFNKFNVAATTGAADWVSNITATGTPTQVVVDEMGGILTITNGTANADLSAFQWKGFDATTDVAEIFSLDTTKEAWFKTRFRLVDGLNTAFFAGLIATNTTPFTAFTNGIYFTKPGATRQVSFGLSKAAANTVLSLGTGALVVDNTYINVGFHYSPTGVNGQPGFNLWCNDVRVASQAVLTNAPVVTLAPSFGFQNATAGAKVGSIDYIHMAASRATP